MYKPIYFSLFQVPNHRRTFLSNKYLENEIIKVKINLNNLGRRKSTKIIYQKEKKNNYWIFQKLPLIPKCYLWIFTVSCKLLLNIIREVYTFSSQRIFREAKRSFRELKRSYREAKRSFREA